MEPEVDRAQGRKWRRLQGGQDTRWLPPFRVLEKEASTNSMSRTPNLERAKGESAKIIWKETFRKMDRKKEK